MEKMNCAVLGATGVVGQNFLRLLQEHPYFELKSVCASDSRIGEKLGYVRELIPGGIPPVFAPLEFDPMRMDILKKKDIRVVFSALPADIAVNVEMEAAKRGMAVFSNAGAYRMDPQIPILIPEINADHLDLVKQQQKKYPGFIITNANCTTTGLALSLLPLAGFNIEELIVSSYQAISGSGYPGHSALDMLNNVIPYIKNEEPKMRQECLKIFGNIRENSIELKEWNVYAHCIRVPTEIGHLISVHVKLKESVEPQSVEALFRNFSAPAIVRDLPTAPSKPVLFTEDPLRPQPRLDLGAGTPERAKGMAVVVGRLNVENNIIRFVTLSNNLIRGAAGGSVLNAELAYREKRL
ncbi:aspartate-semialdehyde dehydrogenase [candidate division KSB1 bacterium]|nr:aspartate-semialdehyde dehydrogenase [candidate division KSB1 bacterium]